MQNDTTLPPGFETWEALYNFAQLEGLVRPGIDQVELRVNLDQSPGTRFHVMAPIVLVSFHYSIQFIKDQAYEELKLKQLRQTFTVDELLSLSRLVHVGLATLSVPMKSERLKLQAKIDELYYQAREAQKR